MARTSQAPAPATAPEPKAPDFIAWHVSNRGDKAFWTKVGAAWFHRDRAQGSGFHRLACQ